MYAGYGDPIHSYVTKTSLAFVGRELLHKTSHTYSYEKKICHSTTHTHTPYTFSLGSISTHTHTRNHTPYISYSYGIKPLPAIKKVSILVIRICAMVLLFCCCCWWSVFLALFISCAFFFLSFRFCLSLAFVLRYKYEKYVCCGWVCWVGKLSLYRCVKVCGKSTTTSNSYARKWAIMWKFWTKEPPKIKATNPYVCVCVRALCILLIACVEHKKKTFRHILANAWPSLNAFRDTRFLFRMVHRKLLKKSRGFSSRRTFPSHRFLRLLSQSGSCLPAILPPTTPLRLLHIILSPVPIHFSFEHELHSLTKQKRCTTGIVVYKLHSIWME